MATETLRVGAAASAREAQAALVGTEHIRYTDVR